MTASLALGVCGRMWAVHCWSTQNFPVLVTMDGVRMVLGVLVVVVAAPVVGYAMKHQAAVLHHKILIAIFILFEVLGFLSLNSIVKAQLWLYYKVIGTGSICSRALSL